MRKQILYFRLLRFLILRSAVDAKLADATKTASNLYEKIKNGENVSSELQV